jgi:DNA helicase HerA-like ATPase
MATIKPSEHVFIAGSTGSGKTFLSKVYLAGSEKPVFVLDTKGTFTWEQIPESLQITVTHLSDLPAAVQKYRFIIYRPVSEELEPEFYNEFFKFCYNLWNCTVCVDEAMQVCPNPFRQPQGYKDILQRGRERNVNVWSCTQRPANIPVAIYSEATHWFVFQLNALTDRKKLSEVNGYDEYLTRLPKQEFYYQNVDAGIPPERGKLVVRKD